MYDLRLHVAFGSALAAFLQPTTKANNDMGHHYIQQFRVEKKNHHSGTGSNQCNSQVLKETFRYFQGGQAG